MRQSSSSSSSPCFLWERGNVFWNGWFHRLQRRPYDLSASSSSEGKAWRGSNFPRIARIHGDWFTFSIDLASIYSMQGKKSYFITLCLCSKLLLDIHWSFTYLTLMNHKKPWWFPIINIFCILPRIMCVINSVVRQLVTRFPLHQTHHSLYFIVPITCHYSIGGSDAQLDFRELYETSFLIALDELQAYMHWFDLISDDRCIEHLINGWMRCAMHL